METIRDKKFTEIYSHILGEIERGSVDRKHGFHLLNFSTYDEESGYPDSRIVVLRKLIKNNFTLRFHTDLRSKKIAHLQKNFKSCYYVPKAPSSVIDKPILNDDLDVEDKNLGYKVFSIIEAKVVELDILELNYSGHVRVKMEVQNGDLISSRWIMP